MEQEGNKKINKDEIEQMMAERQYDLSVHFSRKIKIDLDLNQQKARSFIMLPQSSTKKEKGDTPVMKICVTFASNQAL